MTGKVVDDAIDHRHAFARKDEVLTIDIQNLLPSGKIGALDE